MHENLARDGHKDLTAAASAINPDTERQAESVFATAQQQITDLFVGNFAESGSFSVREYMQNPDCRILVLDYPTRRSGDDRARVPRPNRPGHMHGMDDPDRSAYYLLDEIEHLDTTIKRLGELINVGRGVNCQAIISLQSVAQLEDTYGKERAHALLSGMITVIVLRTADDGASISSVRPSRRPSNGIHEIQGVTARPARARRKRSIVSRKAISGTSTPVRP